MRLSIDGRPCDFVPIGLFRVAMGLPLSFGIALFQHKDYTNLGSIEGAELELEVVRRAVLEAVPTEMPAEGWSSLAITLQILFRRLLGQINPKVGLRPSEVDYAVNGLGEVCHLTLHRAFRALMHGEAIPGHEAIYADWLSRTVQILPTRYSYLHGNQVWRLWVVRHAFGRIGLMIDSGAGIHYVLDRRYVCQAEAFMEALLLDVIQRITGAIREAASRATA